MKPEERRPTPEFFRGGPQIYGRQASSPPEKTSFTVPGTFGGRRWAGLFFIVDGSCLKGENAGTGIPQAAGPGALRTLEPADST